MATTGADGRLPDRGSRNAHAVRGIPHRGHNPAGLARSHASRRADFLGTVSACGPESRSGDLQIRARVVATATSAIEVIYDARGAVIREQVAPAVFDVIAD